MKPIVLSNDQWRTIREDLHTMYPRSVFALRNKMKDVLGFTVRSHRNWVSEKESPVLDNDNFDHGYYVDETHLDFYNEKKRTMFLLKFGHIVGETPQ